MVSKYTPVAREVDAPSLQWREDAYIREGGKVKRWSDEAKLGYGPNLEGICLDEMGRRARRRSTINATDHYKKQQAEKEAKITGLILQEEKQEPEVEWLPDLLATPEQPWVKRTIVPGDEKTYPREGDYVTVHYTGFVMGIWEMHPEHGGGILQNLTDTAIDRGDKGNVNSEQTHGLSATYKRPHTRSASASAPGLNDLAFRAKYLTEELGGEARPSGWSASRDGSWGTCDARVFASSYMLEGTAKPYVFRVGGDPENPFQNNLVKGWDLAMPTMSLGEKAVIDLKSDMAYGPYGASKMCPPHSDIRIECHLLKVESGGGWSYSKSFVHHVETTAKWSARFGLLAAWYLLYKLEWYRISHDEHVWQGGVRVWPEPEYRYGADDAEDEPVDEEGPTLKGRCRKAAALYR